MIVDLSSASVSTLKTVKESDASNYDIDYTAINRRFVSFDEYMYIKDALDEMVLTGDKESRYLKRLAIEEEINCSESCERYCDRCGKKFYAKPWNELGLPCNLCKECCDDFSFYRIKDEYPLDVRPWSNLYLANDSSRILDEIIRNY